MFQEYLIPILTFVAVITIGTAILLLRAVREQSLRSRLSLGTGTEEDPAAQDQGWMVRFAARMGQLMGVGGKSKALQQRLVRAGYHSEMSGAVFLGAKVLLLTAGLGVAGAMTLPLDWPFPSKMVVVLAVGAVGAFIPDMVVRVRKNRRQREVRRHLPDAIDLLEICVSGGMGLEMAWNVVTDEVSQVSMLLGDEMAFTNLEIHLGASRSVAMRHMSDRTGCEEVSSLTTALTQSEQFGTSIGEALRVFAASMRESRSLKAAEAAEKMSVRLLFPLIFLIFPAMFVVVVGPAAIRLVWLFGTQQ
jgi:tight adherence protein C